MKGKEEFLITSTKRFHVISIARPPGLTLRAEKGSLSPANSNKETKWLSKRLAEATGYTQDLQFDENVLATIEGDIKKCRASRERFQLMDRDRYGYSVFSDYWGPYFQRLIQETEFSYDTSAYPIADRFLEMIGLTRSINLSKLHIVYFADKGQIKNRDEKRDMLSGILMKDKRQPFHDLFIRFVLEVIAPHVHSVYKCKKIYFQSFPCLRIVRPGEFSIGPHCDAYYGFSQANINFYVPLTSISGTNSLIIESEPGKEDWHTIELEYGGIKRFYGAQCAHFTPENTTDTTRVSMDFRIICGDHWVEDHDHFTQVPGYYAVCEYVHEYSNTTTGGDISSSELDDDLRKGKWVVAGDILDPDWRVGFPFVR